MFSKLLVYLCQVSNDDGPYPIIGPDNVETKSIAMYHWMLFYYLQQVI